MLLASDSADGYFQTTDPFWQHEYLISLHIYTPELRLVVQSIPESRAKVVDPLNETYFNRRTNFEMTFENKKLQ